MSDFRYRFETVLRNKERVEQDMAAQCRAVKELIELETGKRNEAIDKEKAIGLSMAAKRNMQVQSIQEIQEIRMYDTYLIYLAEFIEKKKDEIRELNAKLKNHQRLLMEARREKMTFEKLKERDIEKHSDMLAAEEQKMLDESALFRFRAQTMGIS
jgi:flagellar FliJ protein